MAFPGQGVPAALCIAPKDTCSATKETDQDTAKARGAGQSEGRRNRTEQRPEEQDRAKAGGAAWIQALSQRRETELRGELGSAEYKDCWEFTAEERGPVGGK